MDPSWDGCRDGEFLFLDMMIMFGKTTTIA